MRAVKLVSPGTLRLEEVDVGDPGPGEVRVKIAGAGLCHSDLHVLELGDRWPVFGGTIGHEGAGWVDAVGPGVQGFSGGESVIVALVWGCGHCRACIEGRENACQVNGSRTAFPTTPGLGPDGAMAEYMLVQAQYLERIGDLDPVTSAPLADAGVTPMHAINSTRHRLNAGATVVVVGIGGLGHLGLQILKSTTGARIIALDNDPVKLRAAEELGADLVLPGDPAAAQQVLDQTSGYGADVIIDFVGAQSTVDFATRAVAPEGLIQFVGLGGGRMTFAADVDGESLPWGVCVQRSYAGTRTDLLQVIALAQQGKLHVETVTYPLTDFQRAFDDLSAGTFVGRAVLVP
ncbi:alcohol dehydrogenase catalytic domain-containing protein [Mycolicibacter heraklionensis]|uniref:alcohol dehydrogenase n=1 Tax=Mycolicibacter heraklionensis TaxID=512402 RepID=A0A9X7WGL0_9MYCO|nr:alcohol dehydrogenase catalytic domain-containing protein [Mycolicibacter heraklionensis]QZA07871.1 alcohol dehydrogenase catalytic domain-containing protein [Mycolicibacter heraklionensis]